MIAGLIVSLMTFQSQTDVRTYITEGYALTGISRGGRNPVSVDPIQYRLVRDDILVPLDGQTIPLADGRTATWKKVKAGSTGGFNGRDIQAGYLFAAVEMLRPKTVLFEISGNGMAYVNGQPHAGDPYGYGYHRFPAILRQGFNSVIVTSGRGELKISYVPLTGPTIDTADPTLPDLVSGQGQSLLAGVTVINSGQTPLRAALRASLGGGSATTPPITVPPLSTRKCPVSFTSTGKEPSDGAKLKVDLLDAESKQSLSSAEFALRVRKPGETRKVTFISEIDGSVQYYALNPSKKPGKDNALILSVHGASVEAIGQADAYAAKDWANLIAPTNRRPYGFDWEDWGRLDALEVLALAKKTYPHDPQRIVLTGHSMGGHGTWHLGVTFPDLFAAIAPSAGWSSFFSYGGSRRIEPAEPVAAVMARAMNPSDTLSLTRNTLLEQVYILHGDADDNVPVTEARLMRDNLAKFHPRLQYFEQPGAGHWWSIDQGPGYGAACVDWKPIMDMFKVARLPLEKDLNEIEFVTANPAVSGRCHWVTIEQQEKAMAFSRVVLKRTGTSVSGQTENVALLSLSGKFDQAVLDGQTIRLNAASRVYLKKQNGVWNQVKSLPAGEKSSQRSGPFKQAMQKRMVFVYGTGGTAGEADWAFNKARFDAEQWQYRGNGAVDVVPDTADPKTYAGRNVILYGNADTNKWWTAVLKGCPIQVRNGALTVGAKTLRLNDLGCLFVYPRAGSKENLVGVYAGTGTRGMRSLDRLPVFSAGVAYPDWMVVSPEIYVKGMDGILGAGYFGNDWKIETGETAWR